MNADAIAQKITESNSSEEALQNYLVLRSSINSIYVRMIVGKALTMIAILLQNEPLEDHLFRMQGIHDRLQDLVTKCLEHNKEVDAIKTITLAYNAKITELGTDPRWLIKL